MASTLTIVFTGCRAQVVKCLVNACAIPEIALLPFAGVALQVASAVLPTYRTRFSKHQFTQPQLLAILCLMRYEDWAFREAEVRLREHSELRAVLRLSSVPDYTTV
jgi:hypothetical protein